MLACQTKHVKLLRKLLSDRSAQRWLIVPYFKKTLDFAMARSAAPSQLGRAYWTTD